jgi:hypothetical protein
MKPKNLRYEQVGLMVVSSEEYLPRVTNPYGELEKGEIHIPALNDIRFKAYENTFS